MYRCCNFKRFLRLLCIDALVFLCLFITASAAGCFSAGADIEKSSDEYTELPVIMYHSVFDERSERYVVPPQELENDLIWIKRSGYSTVTASQLAEHVENGAELPQKPIMLTFDDGFYNNLHYALPLLEKYDMNAVISVVGSYTDSVAPQDIHKPAYAYLTWDDIVTLLDSGRVEIGNHTYNMHTNTLRKGCMRKSGESEESYVGALSADIGLLQSMLYANTGYTPITFAYPFGYISPESIPVLKEFGFRVTLSCYEGINKITSDPKCLFGLKRYNRDGSLTTEEFMKKLQ